MINKMRENAKKKGFTLIELIAVIAILAILAAVIIPKVSNYTSDANTSRYLTNARTIVNAVELYNSDCEDAKSQINDSDSIAAIAAVLGNVGSITHASATAAGDTTFATTNANNKVYILPNEWPTKLRYQTGTAATTIADIGYTYATSTGATVNPFTQTPTGGTLANLRTFIANNAH